MVRLNPKPRRRVQPAAKSNKLAGKSVQLEIMLRHLQPRIWRSFYVPGDIRLDRLHAVIQVVMGWTDSHLHSFRVGNHEYLQPDPDNPGWQETMSDMIIHDEARHILADLITADGDSFEYTYDFGDNWEHDVLVVKIDSALERLPRARCFHGERACPPEDCGSVPGYEEILEVLANPKHPQHAQWDDWLPPEFDPARFDVDATNRLLRRIKV
jgi:hypothetical protein